MTVGGVAAPLGARGRLLAPAGVAAALLFAVLTATYDRGWVLRTEVRLEEWRRGLPSWAHDAGHAFDWLGGHWWLPPVVLVAFGLLALGRRFRDAAFLVAASGGADLFLHAIKLVVDRDRPGEGGTLPVSAAFPSGHATTALTIYVALALLAFPHLPRGRVRARLVAAAVLLAVAVGLGRFVYGVKTAGDVVGGLLLGVVWLAIVVRVFTRVGVARGS